MYIDRNSLPEITDEIKQSWQTQRRDHSAGGVAYERREQGSLSLRTRSQYDVRIALIATHNGARWQLPKGTVEESETPLTAAIREVEEESGLQTEKEIFLQTVEYWYWDTYRKDVPVLVSKRVDFYLLRATGGVLSDASHEVDAVGWFTLEQAKEKLTYADEQAVLERAVEWFDEQGDL